MSTLLQQLTARNLQHYGVSKPSFESAEHEKSKENEEDLTEGEIDAVEDDLNDGWGDPDEQEEMLEEQQKELDKQTDVAESFESLLMGTLDAYGVHGMNERGAELYRLSVESLFKQYGMPGFADVVVPSFEDSATREEHTEKTAEKGAGLIKRMWEAVVKAYEAFTTAVGDMIRRAFTGVSSLQSATTKLKEKAKNMGAKADRKVNVGVAARYLMDKSGDETTGAAQISILTGQFEKFGHSWLESWKALTDRGVAKGLDDPSRAAGFFASIISDSMAIKQITDTGGGQWVALPNHRLVIQGTETEVKDAARAYKDIKEFKVNKMTWEFINKPKSNELEALDKAGVENALMKIGGAIEVYRRLDTEVQKLVKNTKDVAAQLRSHGARLGLIGKLTGIEKSEDPKTIQFRMLSSGARSLAQAGKAVSFGWGKVMPEYLQYLRANLKHVNASIGAAGKGKAEEAKPTEKADDKKDDSTEEKK